MNFFGVEYNSFSEWTQDTLTKKCPIIKDKLLLVWYNFYMNKGDTVSVSFILKEMTKRKQKLRKRKINKLKKLWKIEKLIE